jgi:hydrocephalus-inducing protein
LGWKNNSLHSDKIAPGMEIPFILKFTPEEKTDYIHNLICETEREKFIVPIRAIGARGFLDISDEIVFSEVPVKIVSSKTILVRNIGDALAKFNIEIDGAFSCAPSIGCVQPGESIQLVIQFHPKV